MKNRIRKILLTACAVIAVSALTACSGTDKEAAADKPAQTDTENPSDAADDDKDTEDENAGMLMEKYTSIQDFLDAPSVKEELSSQIQSALPEDSGMSMEVLAEDNRLVYSIIVEDSSLAKQMTKHTDEMENAFESMAAGMESVASRLSDAINITDPAVVLRFVADDGTEIASREYTAPAAAAAEDTADEDTADEDAADEDAAAGDTSSEDTPSDNAE